MELTAPTGAAIIGTAEIIPGVAQITNLRRDEFSETGVVYSHCGGTDVDWDGQKTREFDGQIVFVDENGQTWLARELVDPVDLVDQPVEENENV